MRSCRSFALLSVSERRRCSFSFCWSHICFDFRALGLVAVVLGELNPRARLWNYLLIFCRSLVIFSFCFICGARARVNRLEALPLKHFHVFLFWVIFGGATSICAPLFSFFFYSTFVLLFDGKKDLQVCVLFWQKKKSVCWCVFDFVPVVLSKIICVIFQCLPFQTRS